MKITILILCFLLCACELKEKDNNAPIRTGGDVNISIIDMRNGVTCYKYVGYGISCLKASQ